MMPLAGEFSAYTDHFFSIANSGTVDPPSGAINDYVQLSVHRNLRDYLRELIIRRGAPLLVRKRLPKKHQQALRREQQKIPRMHLDQQLVATLSKQAKLLETGAPTSFFDKQQEEDADVRAWSHECGWSANARRMSCRDMLLDGWVEKTWDRVDADLLMPHTAAAASPSRNI
jgi:hypothetical protein